MRRRLWGVLAVGWILTISSVALAEPPPTEAEKQAQAKFEKANAAHDQGKIEEALNLFREAEDLHRAAGTLRNIALCEEELGRLASAWAHYKEALALYPPTHKRVPEVKERIAKLEPRVPKLRVRLEKAAPAEMKVLVGERDLAPAEMNTDMPLDPGPYTIRTNAKGYATRTYEVRLGEGESKTLEVGVGPVEIKAAKAAPLVTKIESPSDGFSETIEKKPFPARMATLIGVAGLSAVGIGAGIAGLVLAGTKTAERDAICTFATCLTKDQAGYFQQKERWVALDEQRASMTDMGLAGFVVGGVALATTGVLFFAWKPTSTPSSGLKSVSFAPTGTGVLMVGSW